MARHRPTQNPYTRPAIFTLERLHAELGGAILENRQKYDELSERMRQVEAVIKMLDPDYNLAGIAVKRRKPNKWFKRGTLYRRAVDMLRTAPEPMTAQELAAAKHPDDAENNTPIHASASPEDRILRAAFLECVGSG
ncbi:hypothetical protein [Bradyrhizobium guangdongense]